MRKYVICLARFPGNNQEHPDSAGWVIETALKAQKDERIERVLFYRRSDTPITMVRNDCLDYCLGNGVDYVWMIDSDMRPDMPYPGSKPFWQVSTDFLFGRVPPSIIAAPYVGPPPHENPYTFVWRNFESDSPTIGYKLDKHTREEAAAMTGISRVAALPTGLIGIDLRVLARMTPPYFYYEFNERGTEKESTEDVTFTRDASLAWYDEPGAGCFVAWDSWAGHWKLKCCAKPEPVTVEMIGEQFKTAIELRKSATQKLLMVGDATAPYYKDGERLKPIGVEEVRRTTRKRFGALYGRRLAKREI